MEATRLRLLSIAFSLILLLDATTAQMPGFVSLDCGGTGNFTDELGLEWTPDDRLIDGKITNISVANETRKQYQTLRYFPADDRKYCYTLEVISRTRYLVRATFLYGNFDNNNVYPKFDISLGATHWATIVISDANTIELQELIFLALDPTISVCLSNATTGQPFISTLELRQFNGSVYLTQYESQFYLSTSARIILVQIVKLLSGILMIPLIEYGNLTLLRKQITLLMLLRELRKYQPECQSMLTLVKDHPKK